MYLDVLLLANVIINYFMLLFTAKLFRRQPGFKRLLAGAFLGALTVLTVALPQHSYIPLLTTLLAPGLMAAAVFWPVRRLELIFLWGTLFLVSFLTGGTAYAVSLMGSSTSELPAAPGSAAALLTGVLLLLYFVLSVLRPYLEEKKWQKIYLVNLSVAWRGKVKEFAAYMDSGNRLREPISQRPVIIVDYRCLKELLPPVIYQALKDPSQEPWAALQTLDDTNEASCFTLVPFSGIGAAGGLLLAFKPDEVTIFREDGNRSVGSSVVIGLTRRSFGSGAHYQGLLPPELLQAV